MKANNNIKQLKEIVNNEIFFDLNYQGVQAYNISANEYEVITEFRKVNGRYYFIDRDGNKYLASRYDRADFIAGEMLEQKERENKMINNYIDSIEKSGTVKVVLELVYEYVNTCEARGIDSGKLIDCEENAAGELYNVYRRESAADEQQNSESEESAEAAEPSRFADILAKVKSGARKVCEQVANVAFFVVVVGISLFALYLGIVGLTVLFDVCGIEGGSWAAVALSLFLVLTVIFDFCAFVELNTMALICRLFPSWFEPWQRVKFTRPFSVWYRIIKQATSNI